MAGNFCSRFSLWFVRCLRRAALARETLAILDPQLNLFAELARRIGVAMSQLEKDQQELAGLIPTALRHRPKLIDSHIREKAAHT